MTGSEIQGGGKTTLASGEKRPKVGEVSTSEGRRGKNCQNERISEVWILPLPLFDRTDRALAVHSLQRRKDGQKGLRVKEDERRRRDTSAGGTSNGKKTMKGGKKVAQKGE